MEKHYNLDSEQLAAITTGVGVVGGVGVALAQRQRRQLSEIEQKFGRRPIMPGKKRQEWEKKVNDFYNAQIKQQEDKERNKRIVYIVAGSVLGLAIIGGIIYAIKKQK